MKTLYLILCLVFLNCANDNFNSNDSLESNWCVPESTIGGGVSIFPFIDNPSFMTISEIESLNFLSDYSKLALLKVDNELYVFPYDYTNYYEVINFNFNDFHLAMTYCPLTQSAICFNREIATNVVVDLKASGYLYNNNLVLMEVDSNNYWSQMSTKVLRGSNKDIELKTFKLIETTWSIIKSHFPNALVFYHQNIDPCDGCTASSTTLNLNNKFGIINEHVIDDTAHLFDYESFINGIKIQYATVNNKSTMIIGSKNMIFMNSFYIPTGFNFTALDEAEFPLILSDNYGNKWDVFGSAVEGPNIDMRLNSPKSYFAADWAWDDFFVNQISYN